MMSSCDLKAEGQQTTARGLFSFYKPRIRFTFLVVIKYNTKMKNIDKDTV